MQLRSIIAAAGITAAVGLTSTVAAGACETPLPDDISIASPSGSLPPERAAFLGMWGNGEWDGVLCNTLVVEDIDDEGNVKAVYSWGTYAGWNVWKGQARTKFTFIEGNKIRANFRNGAEVTYWLEGDKLKGTYVRRGNTYRVTLVRK